ncbi:MAG: SUMF1/EgtB/PvdO family nonheme iron enzyme [Chloroflexi bacterium]|nr:SUMF1/EgtB/PvdO family nonheme iron enzyme [Chloroflexota bacterium]
MAAAAEQKRIAAEKVELERIVKEKTERERLAAQKAEEERIAAEKAEKAASPVGASPETPAPAKPIRLTPPDQLMPAPFAWIEIPGGSGTLKTSDRNVTLAIPTERYRIAKYPVTNAQYAKFIEAGGYTTERWWTAAGWTVRQQEKWTEPRYWRGSDFNGAQQPVVGVSWYESMAFCLWLSETTGERIMLPTEAQWQYAAQDQDGRDYPWGNNWDGTRCNNQVDGTRWFLRSKPPGHGERTTAVTAYEGRGDSPFGVVDMAGNVWEWCRTQADTLSNDENGTDVRFLRGGSWYFVLTDDFRCADRDGGDPVSGLSNRGFRLVLY